MGVGLLSLMRFVAYLNFFHLIFLVLGYAVATDLIEWMQDYCDNEHQQARQLVAHADKWIIRLKQQSSLVSYHTTKRAQLDVVRVARELAQLKESTCTELRAVIDRYRNYVNEIYVAERFRPGRRHRRTNEFKKAFKAAHSSSAELAKERETLQAQEKKVREALHTADSVCEILDLDPTTTEKQRARASDLQSRKRASLEEVEGKIEKNKVKHRSAQKAYRKQAIEIFKQCQYVEEERLEQTRETLLDFIQAMHPASYSSSLNQIFEGLTNKVTTQQNSFDDLLFWAKTYGIENKLTKSITSNLSESDEGEEESESASRTKKKVSHREKPQPVSVEHEDEEEEPSAPISNTTAPAKTRVKRTKNVSTAEKKNTTHVDPATHVNNTILNQVWSTCSIERLDVKSILLGGCLCFFVFHNCSLGNLLYSICIFSLYSVDFAMCATLHFVFLYHKLCKNKFFVPITGHSVRINHFPSLLLSREKDNTGRTVSSENIHLFLPLHHQNELIHPSSAPVTSVLLISSVAQKHVTRFGQFLVLLWLGWLWCVLHNTCESNEKQLRMNYDKRKKVYR